MSARSKAIVNETGNSPVELSRVPTAITGQPPLVTSSIDPSGGKRSEHVPSRDTDPCALQSNTICPVISAGSTGVGVGVGAWNGLQAATASHTAITAMANQTPLPLENRVHILTSPPRRPRSRSSTPCKLQQLNHYRRRISSGKRSPPHYPPPRTSTTCGITSASGREL